LDGDEKKTAGLNSACKMFWPMMIWPYVVWWEGKTKIVRHAIVNNFFTSPNMIIENWSTVAILIYLYMKQLAILSRCAESGLIVRAHTT
jgi:hypothetical protein